MLSCSGPNIPASILWFLRAAMLVGLALMLFGPKGVRSYGASALFASMGMGAISLTTASWHGAGAREVSLGKVMVVVLGLCLLGAASAVLVVDCGLR